MTVFYNWSCYYKHKKQKKNFEENHFHSILRLFDVFSNLPFTTSETKSDY